MRCPDILKSGVWLRLSHVLSHDTPAFGGGDGLAVNSVRSMDRGDTCNAAHLSLSNHLGSHVDAPRHFLADGKAVGDYAVGDWFFYKPLLVDMPAEEGEILGISRFDEVLKGCGDADILLVRTGFELLRGQDEYWAASPAFEPDVAPFLSKRLPSLRAIGLDTISLASCQHRELGRKAHQEFLGAGLRIFEDLALAELVMGSLQMVIGFPLLFDNADAAPCTVAAWTKNARR